MLERGKPMEHPNYPTATKDPWEFPNGMRLTEEDKERGYVQKRHYCYRGDNKAFYINDLENPYTEIKRFDWIRGDVVGGRSLLWARMATDGVIWILRPMQGRSWRGLANPV